MWKLFFVHFIQRQKLKRKHEAKALRLEEKLQNCNSFFSIETALATSISTGSAIDDEQEFYQNKCHFSVII